MRYMRAFVDRDNGDADGPLRVTAATEGLKPDGLDLRMDSVRLDRWRSNPVVLYGHMAFGRDNLPVGRADNIHVDGAALRADVTFDSGDEFAAQVERKYRDGFLNAFSVGFDLGNVDRSGVPEWWEPVEVSAVPVPMDADALVEDGRSELATLARTLERVRGGQLDRDSIRRLMGFDRQPISPHQTATDTESNWDGPGAVSEAANDAAVLRYMHAWRDPDGDPDAKNTYSFPHHGPRTDAAANIAAVNNALARLPQSGVPEGERDGVERHLRDHREDAGLDRAMSDDETRSAAHREGLSEDDLLEREQALRSVVRTPSLRRIDSELLARDLR